jgi:hypothetical protein
LERVPTPATIKESFKWKYRANVNSEVLEVSFAAGEQVDVLKEWKNDACLIKKNNQVFNVPKKYLNIA